ncbi:hypothetical protein D3C83_93330 [compost metagenome]
MLCSCRRASDHESTGAKQASEPSNTLHHSSRVFALKAPANAAFISGQRDRSYWGGMPSSSRRESNSSKNRPSIEPMETYLPSFVS